MTLHLRATYLLAGTLLVASVSLASSKTTAPVLENPNDRASYALGVEMGEAFKSQKIEINPTYLSRGLQDALQNKPFLLSEKAIGETLIAFRQEQLAAQEAQMQDLAEKNATVGEAFLANNKTNTEIKATDSGLQYKVLQAGKGNSPKRTSKVLVNYEGRFLDGQVFDSSYKRGQPASFRLTEVIPGWTEALQLMNQGAVWEIYVPAKLAYGEAGIGGVIGPNETLVFKVELLSFEDEKQA